MVKIHRLKQPNKHSGYPLHPGQTTKVRGMAITNTNNFLVHIDRFTRKPAKKKKPATVKKEKPAKAA